MRLSVLLWVDRDLTHRPRRIPGDRARRPGHGAHAGGATFHVALGDLPIKAGVMITLRPRRSIRQNLDDEEPGVLRVEFLHSLTVVAW